METLYTVSFVCDYATCSVEVPMVTTDPYDYDDVIAEANQIVLDFYGWSPYDYAQETTVEVQ